MVEISVNMSCSHKWNYFFLQEINALTKCAIKLIYRHDSEIPGTCVWQDI